MKKYKVILHPDAELDIASSFEWGCRAWGIKNARIWVRELRYAILNQLTSLPFRCPVAPEAEELGISVRHSIIGRYRIVFVIKGQTVTILHVRGPFIAGLTLTNSNKDPKMTRLLFLGRFDAHYPQRSASK